MVTIYHNSRCSKSNATLALLRENGIEPNIVEYLKSPLDADTLREVVSMLEDGSVHDIVRTGDALYRQLGLKAQSPSEAELLGVLVAHPQLMQRPIVVNGDRAAIGRPPQNVLAIL